MFAGVSRGVRSNSCVELRFFCFFGEEEVNEKLPERLKKEKKGVTFLPVSNPAWPTVTT